MDTRNTHSDGRRAFLKGAAAAGAASFMGGAAAQSQNAPTKKLRIGVMGASPSFVSFSWSDIIEPDKDPNSRRGNFGTMLLNMDITHVWDRNFETATGFANRMDATAVRNYDDMVGKVDGIIFGGYDDVPWQPRLAAPYIEAGIPVYLSRPFAFSMNDIDMVLDLAAKHNTPIMATAKYEHYNAVPALKAKLANIGPIVAVQATGWSRDYPMHFHVMFMMMRILGYDIREVSVITDSLSRNNYVQASLVYNGWEDQPPFLCSVMGAPNDEQFSVQILGTKATAEARMLRSPHWRDSLLFRYAPQVIDMQRTFEGNQLEPLEDIRKKTELVLTGYYSHLERGGAPVKVGTIPPDWHPPYPDPDFIDESIF